MEISHLTQSGSETQQLTTQYLFLLCVTTVKKKAAPPCLRSAISHACVFKTKIVYFTPFNLREYCHLLGFTSSNSTYTFSLIDGRDFGKLANKGADEIR